jgi:hypothetical protein
MFLKRIIILLLDFYAKDIYAMVKVKHKGENTITV